MDVSLKGLLGVRKFNSLTKFFTNLYSRWQDENQYEKIEDYAKAIELNFGVKVIKFTKRPFRVEFTIGGLKKFMMIHKGTLSWGAL